jgi:hypothetical protein
MMTLLKASSIAVVRLFPPTASNQASRCQSWSHIRCRVMQWSRFVLCACNETRAIRPLRLAGEHAAYASMVAGIRKGKAGEVYR